MDENQTIVVYALVFIAILTIIFIGGRYVRKIPAAMVKKVNQISFGVAIASGILLYVLHHAIFMYLFLASLVFFFIFFNYKEEG